MKLKHYDTKYRFYNFDGSPIKEEDVMPHIASRRYVYIYRHGILIGSTTFSGKLQIYEDVSPSGGLFATEIDIEGMSLKEILAALKKSMWYKL